MKGKVRRLVVGAAALASLSLVAGSSAALAAGGGGGPTPPWESSINAGLLLGPITFYNAQGQVVTGGSITAPGVAAYAVGSGTAVPAGYSKAELAMYTPVAQQNPGTWSSSFIGISSTFPVTTAPAPIGGLTATNPVNTGRADDQTIASLISAFPNVQTAAGYPNLYDIRMIVSGAGVPQLSGYYDAVISVNITAGTPTHPTAGTWSVDYPDWTQKTTTTLTATPPSQAPPASPATLTATVAPATAGTVSFWNGTTQVGTTQTVTASNGVATVTTTPPTGTTPYTAIYTPAVGSSDIGSSGTLNYVVSTKDATSTTLAQHGGGGPAGPVTFTGTVTDTTTPATTITSGTVSLFDNGSTTAFASGNVGAGGAFSITHTYTSAGSHSVVATFVPASGANFAGSSSAPVTFTETTSPPSWEPVLFGPHRVGSVDSCLAAFQGATTVTYAWQANGTTISGATSSTYKIPALLNGNKTSVGQTLTCSVTATNSAGSVSGTSSGAKIALGPALVPTTKPVLHGPHLPGRAETVTAGKWSPAAAHVTYQWYLNSTKVAGATRSSFTVPRSAKGKTVHCVVTASATSYANGTYTTPSVKIT